MVLFGSYFRTQLCFAMKASFTTGVKILKRQSARWSETQEKCLEFQTAWKEMYGGDRKQSGSSGVVWWLKR